MRDHCHYSGIYKGAAHSLCNQEDSISFLISVEIDKYIKNREERSKEIELRFIDSFNFMSSSLDSIVNNLARGNDKFLDSRIITSPNISYSFKKESTHTNIWMIGINLKKPSFFLRKVSIVIKQTILYSTSLQKT